MSSYLPGVTDYIPQIQSFQPQYNFYSNVLQSKQSQYDAAHKQLSSVYGSLLNGPLLRDSNIARRDQFFQMVDQDLQRISKLDLSKQENVDKAMNVFTPMYKDKYMIRDMFFTKQYQNEMAHAENLRNCVDPKVCGNQYWEGGVKALQYKAEEFKNSSDAESLTFSPPKYTPYVNVTEKAFAKAKEMGFNITTVGKEGGYLVTHKNGQALAAPLYNYFISSFQDDPQVQAMYQTRAYNERKDYAKQNSFQYGSESAAEEAYLLNKFNEIQQATTKELGRSVGRGKVLDSKEALLADKINNSGNGLDENDPIVQAYLALKQEKGVNQSAIGQHENTLKYLDKNGVAQMDINTLRSRVDGAVAGHTFFRDMQNAALTYSALNSEDKMEADPFALKAVDYQHAVALKQMDQAFQREEKEKDRAHDFRKAVLKGEIPDISQRQGGYRSVESDATSTSAESYDELGDIQQKAMQFLDRKTAGQEEYLKGVFNWYAQKAATEPAGSHYYHDQISKMFGIKYDPNRHHGIEDFHVSNLDAVYARANKVTLEDSKSDIMSKRDYLGFEPMRENIKKEADAFGAVYGLKTENDRNVRDYLLAKTGGVDNKLWRMFFDPNGRIANPTEFAQRYEKVRLYTDPELSPEQRGELLSKKSGDARELYSDLYKKYRQTYQEGFSKAEGAPLVRSWRTTPGIAPYSEGLGARVQQGRFDAADKQDPMFMDLLGATEAALDPTAVVAVTPGRIANTEAFKDLGDDRKRLLPIVEAFLNDARSGRYKANDSKRPSGTFEYAGVAANDPNKVAVTLHINEGWAKQYKGSKAVPGLTDDASLYKDGITIYMDKNKVMNTPFWKANLDPGTLRTALAAQPITINSYPEGGNLTVKSDANGYIMEGYMKSVNNGKQVVQPIRAVFPFERDPEQFIPEIKARLKALQETNLHLMESYKRYQGGAVKSTNQLGGQNGGQ